MAATQNKKKPAQARIRHGKAREDAPDVFDQAIGAFALAYADQTERDHKPLVAAEKKGRIEALVEENL
jgi:hypothetical protein